MLASTLFFSALLLPTCLALTQPLSTYYIALEGDYSGAITGIYTCSSRTLIKLVPTAFARAVADFGMGKLLDGRILLDPGDTPQCVDIYSGTDYPFGVGSDDNALAPFTSLASNTYPFGTKVFIRQLQNVRLPTGQLHNGCFKIDDFCPDCADDFSLFTYTQSYSSFASQFLTVDVTAPSTCSLASYSLSHSPPPTSPPPPASPPPISPPPDSPPPKLPPPIFLPPISPPQSSPPLKSPPPVSPPPVPNGIPPSPPQQYPWTNYWINDEKDYPGIASVPLRLCDANDRPSTTVIKFVTPDFARDAGKDGTGNLTDGRLININNYDADPAKQCWFFSKHKYGTGSDDNALVPFVSVAVASGSVLAFGSKLYVRELDGRAVPGANGMRHNGCVRVDDECGSCGEEGVPRNNIDFFSLTKTYFNAFDADLHHVTASKNANCDILDYIS